jgi:sigma-B regulation protein RsbU (phosphoserine phosphatase)
MPARPHVNPQWHKNLLDRILNVARHLSASADLTDILQVVIDAMRDTLDAERATVFEYSAATGELFTTVAHGLAAGRDSPTEIRIPVAGQGGGLAGECAQSRRVINVQDAYHDPRFNPEIDKQTRYRTRSILAIPLLGHDGELVGVAQVLNKRRGAFTRDDEEVAQALAAQAAVAIKRGRLLQDRLVRQKLERDLELARRIQQSSFPQALPTLRSIEIAAWNQPADLTGGDVYDVMVRPGTAVSRLGDLQPLSGEVAASPYPHAGASPNVDRVVLLMADATGHGIGPALSITQLRSMLRIGVRLGATLLDLARHANIQLCDDLPGGRFITAWFGELEDCSGKFTMLSAGQAPLLHFHAANGHCDMLEATTVPLGILSDFHGVAPVEIHLNPGDVFAVCSDGITEAHDSGDVQFGFDRLIDCVRRDASESAHTILARLQAALNEFTANQPPDDDRTAIILKRR